MRWIALFGIAACAGSTAPDGGGDASGVDGGEAGLRDGGEDDAGEDSGTLRCDSTLPRRGAEPAAAERGRALLTESVLPPGVIPRLGIDNLWLVWGTGALSGDAYWEEFRGRYGFIEAPFPNDGLPIGIRAVGGNVTFDCLTCHAGEVAGEVIVGAANTRLDFESLFDDLVVLNEMAPMFGYPSFPVPFDLDGFTPAAGTTDAFGLAMRLSMAISPGEVSTEFGPQRSPAWWTVAAKEHLYTDGSGTAGGHRTMMGMLLAFGLSLPRLMEMDEEISDIGAFITSLEAPCWPYPMPPPVAVERGQAVFTRECASCHGVYDGVSEFPGRVVDVETDAMRQRAWAEREVARVNASWFGEPPTRDTSGYLAQPLVGVWARAPYLHNGSVPDLQALLTPSERPRYWRRTGSSRDDYDPERVGWRFETIDAGGDPDTREGRQIIDTERPGLGNGGHRFGEGLTTDERSDLLKYLVTL